MGSFRPASYQNPCLFVQNLLVWEADFPVLCPKFPSLKCLLPPHSPCIIENSLFYTTATTPTCQCLHPRIHWQVTESETPSLGCCFHYFSAYGCSVLLFPTHCWLQLSCLQFLILANESSVILILVLGGMPFPLQQSDLHLVFWNAPWTNELHRGIEFSKESPEKEPCSLGVMTDFRSGTGNIVR